MGEVLIQNEAREVATITGEQLLQKIAAALGIVMTVESVTTETECEALQLQGSCSNPLNPQRYAMNPALVTPTRWAPTDGQRGARTISTQTPPDVFDFVRHGVLVKTDSCVGGSCVYVFIGGTSSSWFGGADRLTVFQGGAEFVATGNKGFASSLTVKGYPLMMLPVKGGVKNFVQPYNPSCEVSAEQKLVNRLSGPVLRGIGMVQQAINHLSWAGAGMIPTYVPEILYDVYSRTLNYTTQVYQREAPNRNRYFIVNSVRQKLIGISDDSPTFLPTLIGMPDISLMDLPTVAVYPNLGAVSGLCRRSDINLIKQIFTDLDLYLKTQNPMIQGAPVLVGGLCTGECSSLNVAGFITPPSSTYLDLPQYSASILYPTPRSWATQDLEDYARQLGIYDQFMTSFNATLKAAEAEVVLTSLGLEQEIATKLINSVSWLGSLFQHDAKDVAKMINDEIKREDHTHTDELGQELHDAYLCYRFGHC